MIIIKKFLCNLGIAIALFSVAFIAVAATQKCTQREAIEAENEASTLKTWSEIFTSYQHYQYCDDGAISEGYSNSVATLLAKNWDQVNDLLALIHSHPKFEVFVLRHIDETMTSDQGDAIEKNVRSGCPMAARRLCMEINRRLSDLGSK